MIRHFDVEAAAKRGIRTVAGRSGSFDKEMMYPAGATELYNDVAALLADFERSSLLANRVA